MWRFGMTAAVGLALLAGPGAGAHHAQLCDSGHGLTTASPLPPRAQVGTVGGSNPSDIWTEGADGGPAGGHVRLYLVASGPLTAATYYEAGRSECALAGSVSTWGPGVIWVDAHTPDVQIVWIEVSASGPDEVHYAIARYPLAGPLVNPPNPFRDDG